MRFRTLKRVSPDGSSLRFAGEDVALRTKLYAQAGIAVSPNECRPVCLPHARENARKGNNGLSPLLSKPSDFRGEVECSQRAAGIELDNEGCSCHSLSSDSLRAL